MSSSVSLPPDQSLRISRLNANLIVLSVAEDGIKLGKGTSLEDIAKSRSYTGGAHYFAETAVVSSNGSSPSGLTLAAWELICPKIATLDTNGPDGAENGDSTRRNGKEGGSLALYVQDLDDASAKNLSLETYGGTGGNATEQTATAGDGGKGGKMFTILQPTYVNLLTKATGYFKRAEFHPSDEEKEKQYKVLVRKKDLLYSLAQDLVSNGNSLNASTETVKAIFQTLSQELAKDDKDRTVLSVKLATAKALRKLKNLIQDQRTEMTPQVDDVRGGYSGVGINVDVDPGKKGEDGMNSQIFLSTWDPAILVHATVPFVHPDQCRMLLERANFFFYLNSPKTRNRARDIYQRIMNRLAFLQFLKTDHPLYKAYETYTTKKIMPRGSIESLRTSLNAAKNQLLHLNQGKVDFNGYWPLWVPRANYDFYKSFLDSAFDSFVSTEKAYISYCTALDKEEALTDKVKLAYQNMARVTGTLNADNHDLKVMLQKKNDEIVQQGFDVIDAQKVLSAAYDEEKSAIKAAFGVSVPQIVNAFTLIAFAPHDSMMNLQLDNLLYEGFYSVPKIDGTKVTKEYLASEIQQSEASIQAVSLVLKHNTDGTFQLDKAYALRVIVQKERMMNMLNSFSKEALGGVKDEEKRKKLMEKFDAYIKVVTERNDTIIEYNSIVKLILAKQDEITKLQAKERELADQKISYENSDLSSITAYVSALYQSSRSRVMKLLNLLVRALNFRMLELLDVYKFISPGADSDPMATKDVNFDSLPLSLTSESLKKIRTDIEDEFANGVNYWGSEPSKFPADFESTIGKRFYLPEGNRKALLKRPGQSMSIKIPAVDIKAKKPPDFVGCCNIRIYRVRFGLTSAKLASSYEDKLNKGALIKFTLIHGGKETLIRRNNQAFEFKHDTISVVYSVRLYSDGTQKVLDNGNIAMCDVNKTSTSYAAPGPFTMWTINMAGTEFDKLDLSGVDDAFFDFCGTNHPFDVS